MGGSIDAGVRQLSPPDLKLVASMLAVPGRSKVSGDKLATAIVDDIRKPRELFRDIESLSDGVQYSDPATFYRIENALCSYNCHHGQRKLFFTMLEFMTLCAARMSMADTLVVYVGAAPGYNMRLIADLFPLAQYLLVDPAAFDIKESHNIRLWRRIFTDQSVPEVLQLKRRLNKVHLLFVSDIRINPSEEDITRDMVLQQRWGVKMAATAMMFKFRLPYPGSGATVLVQEADKLDTIRDLVDIPASKAKTPNSFLYLDGTVYLQLYAPLRSSETRLVVFRPTGSKSGSKYAMRYWDFKKYEAKMNAFNIVCRSLLSYTKADVPDSQRLGEHLLGYGADYESVAEYHLAYEYLRLKIAQYSGLNLNINPDSAAGHAAQHGKVSSSGTAAASERERDQVAPQLADVVKFLHRLNIRLVQHYTSRVSLMLCAIKTMATHTKKYNELDQATRADQIRKVSQAVITRFRKQLSVVAKGNILGPKEKNEMINIVARDIETLTAELSQQQQQQVPRHPHSSSSSSSSSNSSSGGSSSGSSTSDVEYNSSGYSSGYSSGHSSGYSSGYSSVPSGGSSSSHGNIHGNVHGNTNNNSSNTNNNSSNAASIGNMMTSSDGCPGFLGYHGGGSTDAEED
jgi:Poly A polymerase regulatory subunit